MERYEPQRIDWATHTFNPVTGCLGSHNDGATCPYCYAGGSRALSRSPAFPNGFAPTFHEDRLRDQTSSASQPGAACFVGSMTDLGAPWAAEYLPRILERCRNDGCDVPVPHQAAGGVHAGGVAGQLLGGMTRTGRRGGETT
jgi:DNA repair photolyase